MPSGEVRSNAKTALADLIICLRVSSSLRTWSISSKAFEDGKSLSARVILGVLWVLRRLDQWKMAEWVN